MAKFRKTSAYSQADTRSHRVEGQRRPKTKTFKLSSPANSAQLGAWVAGLSNRRRRLRSSLHTPDGFLIYLHFPF